MTDSLSKERALVDSTVSLLNAYDQSGLTGVTWLTPHMEAVRDALVAFEPSAHALRCEFCGQFMRADGKGHEACLQQYDRATVGL